MDNLPNPDDWLPSLSDEDYLRVRDDLLDRFLAEDLRRVLPRALPFGTIQEMTSA